MKDITIFWFRRDLRLDDNAALYHALSQHENVLCIFIFDKNILDKLADKDDARVTFIYNQLMSIQNRLAKIGSDLKSKKIIGMHWGTFMLTDEPVQEPPVLVKNRLKELDLEGLFTIPIPGKIISLE